nr:MAG TPA: hypothetical protein [Caudoviricetes sp.]
MIDDKMAQMAVNTLKAYCGGKNCKNCAVFSACMLAKCNFHHFASYPLVGVFENTQKPPQKTPKFDGSLQHSQEFWRYATAVLDRALADEGINGLDLLKHGEVSVKIKTNGLVKVCAQSNGRVKTLGKAKCHPNDAFNLETGVRLAVHRMVQDANTPFDPHVGRVYYFINYDGNIMGKPWNDDAIDNCNMVLDNCFKSTFAAWLHITSVKRGIRHLADALRLTPPEPGKAGDADE